MVEEHGGDPADFGGEGAGPSNSNSGTDEGNDTGTGSDTKTYVFAVTNTYTDSVSGELLGSFTETENVQATNQSDAFFNATWGLQTGPGSTQTLDFTTISGGPKESTWDIKWNLSQKSKAGGYIVQEITASSGSSGADYHYWEAWEVKAGSALTSYDGKYPVDDQFRGAAGSSVSAEARFYEGLKLPSSFVVNNPGARAGILPATTNDPKLSLDSATAPVKRTWPN